MTRTSFVPSLCCLAFAACGGGGGGSSPPPAPPTLAFAAPALVPTGGADGRRTVVADLDHDGLLDLLVTNPALANVSVLRGRADGTFEAPTFATAPNLVSGCLAADVDHDRKPDLIAFSDASASLTVAPGNGDGTFAAAAAIAVPWPVSKVVVADWNLDGTADLLVASATVAELRLLRGNGNAGGFQLADTAALPFVAADLAVADFDGNQVVDVAAVGRGGDRIAVLRNSLAGTFVPFVATTTGALGGAFACCDLDGDRRPELVVVEGDLQSVTVYSPTTGGAFAKGATVGMATASIESLALGDLDGDGVVDLAVAAGDGVRVAYGTGAAAFGGSEAAWTGGSTVRAIAARDQVGRGIVDLLCVTGGDKLAVLKNPRGAVTGLHSFGAGTWDCSGHIGMWANGVPSIGKTDFAYLTTNAPADTYGVFLQGGPADELGSDPLGIGALLHVDTGFLVSRLVFSDQIGGCAIHDTMPTSPSYVGLPVHVQTMWFANRALACTGSVAYVASSRGLTITIQP